MLCPTYKSSVFPLDKVIRELLCVIVQLPKVLLPNGVNITLPVLSGVIAMFNLLVVADESKAYNIGLVGQLYAVLVKVILLVAVPALEFLFIVICVELSTAVIMLPSAIPVPETFIPINRLLVLLKLLMTALPVPLVVPAKTTVLGLEEIATISVIHPLPQI